MMYTIEVNGKTYFDKNIYDVMELIEEHIPEDAQYFEVIMYDLIKNKKVKFFSTKDKETKINICESNLYNFVANLIND